MKQETADFSSGGMNMLAGARGKIGPELFAMLRNMLQGGPDYLGLNQQLSDIGHSAEGDVQLMRDEAARRGMGGFTGIESLAASRRATGATQRTRAISQENQNMLGRRAQAMALLSGLLFGKEPDMAALAMGQGQSGDQMAQQQRAALTGGIGTAIGSIFGPIGGAAGGALGTWLGKKMED
jgi:hypothetical protein